MNDLIIFLLLAGVAFIFKWLAQQGARGQEKAQPDLPNEQRPVRRPAPQSDEERVRRFLEALGAPPGSAPPPPVRPRTVSPRTVTTPSVPPRPRVKRTLVQPLPPLVTTPKDIELPPVITTPLSKLEAIETVPKSTPVKAAEGMLLSPPARLTPLTKISPPGSLRALLRTRGGVRQAVILREVIGSPRGLQSFDVISGL